MAVVGIKTGIVVVVGLAIVVDAFVVVVLDVNWALLAKVVVG